MFESLLENLNRDVKLVLNNGIAHAVTIIAVNSARNELTVSEDGSITFLEISTIREVRAQ